MLAARALGLDCGAMSGFDNAKVDAEFFPDGKWRSNFLINLGYGDTSKLLPRHPRLTFEEACDRIACSTSRSCSYAGSVRNSTNVSLSTSSREDLRGLVVTSLAERSAEQLADLLHLLGDHRGDHRLRDLASVVEHALRRADPLPHLRARDLRGGRVFHEIEDRHGALPREPRADVLDRDVDVEAQALLGDRRLGLELHEVGRARASRRRASCSRSGSVAASAG